MSLITSLLHACTRGESSSTAPEHIAIVRRIGEPCSEPSIDQRSFWGVSGYAALPPGEEQIILGEVAAGHGAWSAGCAFGAARHVSKLLKVSRNAPAFAFPRSILHGRIHSPEPVDPMYGC